MDEEIMFPELVRYLREICGVTQDEIADYLEIERSAYTYYETELIIPSNDIMMRFSDILEVTYTLLVDSLSIEETETKLILQCEGSEIKLFPYEDENLLSEISLSEDSLSENFASEDFALEDFALEDYVLDDFLSEDSVLEGVALSFSDYNITADDDLDTMNLTENEKNLLMYFRNLNDTQKEKVLEYEYNLMNEQNS